MNLYEISGGNRKDSYKISKFDGRKCVLSNMSSLQKTMQNGGGALYNLQEGKMLMWPGLITPSIIGQQKYIQKQKPVVSEVIQPRTSMKMVLEKLPSTPIVPPKKEEKPITKISEEKVIEAQAQAQAQAKAEAERKAKAEAERKAKVEAERKAKVEAERKAKVEAERKAKAEAERKAKAEAERKVREAQAQAQAKAERERKVRETQAQAIEETKYLTPIFAKMLFIILIYVDCAELKKNIKETTINIKKNMEMKNQLPSGSMLILELEGNLKSLEKNLNDLNKKLIQTNKIMEKTQNDNKYFGSLDQLKQILPILKTNRDEEIYNDNKKLIEMVNNAYKNNEKNILNVYKKLLLKNSIPIDYIFQLEFVTQILESQCNEKYVFLFLFNADSQYCKNVYKIKHYLNKKYNIEESSNNDSLAPSKIELKSGEKAFTVEEYIEFIKLIEDNIGTIKNACLLGTTKEIDRQMEEISDVQQQPIASSSRQLTDRERQLLRTYAPK